MSNEETEEKGKVDPEKVVQISVPLSSLIDVKKTIGIMQKIAEALDESKEKTEKK